MDFFSDIMCALSSLIINVKGKLAKLQYKYKMTAKENKRFRKGQWIRLFCSQDHNAIRVLSRFVYNNNEWIKIDDSLYNILSSSVFCNCYKYNDVEIYYKDEEVSLFQTETRVDKSRKNYTGEESASKYIRITPMVYPEFQKQYNFYKKKGML